MYTLTYAAEWQAAYVRVAELLQNHPQALANDEQFDTMSIHKDQRGNLHWYRQFDPNTEENTDATFLMMGDIGDHRSGTRLNALGNQSYKSNVVDNNTPIRYQIAVVMPANPTDEIRLLWDEQNGALDRECESGEIRMAALHREAALAADPDNVFIPPDFNVKTFMKSTVKNGPLDTLILSTEPIYAKGAPNTAIRTSAKPKQSRLASNVEESTTPSNTALLTKTYPTSILPDYRGPRFAGRSNDHVITLDIQDITGTVIHPAKVAQELKPGTFAIFRVSLHGWDIVDQSKSNVKNNGGTPRSHVYSVRVHSIFINAESNKPAELGHLSFPDAAESSKAKKNLKREREDDGLSPKKSKVAITTSKSEEDPMA